MIADPWTTVRRAAPWRQLDGKTVFQVECGTRMEMRHTSVGMTAVGPTLTACLGSCRCLAFYARYQKMPA